MLSNISKIFILNMILKLVFCRILDINLLNELEYDNSSIVIDLSKRSIDSIELNTFKNYGNLEIIYLQDNKLKKLDVESFKFLVNLREIWLEDNILVDININVFKELNNLELVCLYNNPISILFPNILNNLCTINNNTCKIIYEEKCKKISAISTLKSSTILTTTIGNNITGKSIAKLN